MALKRRRLPFVILIAAAIAGTSCSSDKSATSSNSSQQLHLAFETGPSTTLEGRPFDPPIVVTVRDESGALVQPSGPVTLSLVSPSGVTATLSGNLSSATQAGTAAFTELQVQGHGTGFMLRAAGPSMPSVTSAPFDVEPAGLAIDSTQLHLISDSADRAAGTFTFQILQPGTALPDSGRVIWGSEGGGFLRRITHVTQSASTVQYQTVAAELGDIMQDTTFAAHVSFPSAAGSSVRRAVFVPRTASLRGVDCSSGSCDLDEPIVLFGSPDNGLMVSSGRLGISGTGDISVGFGAFHVVPNTASFDIGANVTFDATVDAKLSGTATESGSYDLGEIIIPFDAGVFLAELSLEWTASANGTADLPFSWTSSATTKIGATWDHSSGWAPIDSATYSLTPAFPQPSVVATVSVHLGIQAKPRVVLFAVAGGDVTVEPYVEGTADLNVLTGEYSTACNSAVQLGLDLDFGVLSDLLPKYQKELTAASATWPICAHSGTLTAPSIALSSNAVAFAATASGQTPSPATVAITNGSSSPASGLSVGAITYQSGETSGWLQSPTLSATTPPSTLTLHPTTTALADGTYHATVPITAANVVGGPTTIGVTYTITTVPLLAAPTLLMPTPGATGVSTTPTFTWNQVSGANRYWLMIATSSSAFPTDPAATTCASCAMSGFTAATSHTLPNAFPNGNAGPPAGTLAAGTTYYWEVQAFNNSSTPSTLGQYSPASAFTTSASQGQNPTIALSTNTATFNASQGGSNPPAQNSIVLTNSGTGSLTGLSVGTITYQTGQPTGWLVASLTSSAAPANLTLSTVTGSLGAGTYVAMVPITGTAMGVTNNPQTVTVTLVVALPSLAAPTGLVATAAGSSEITLSWTDNSTDEDGFVIETGPSVLGPFSVYAYAPANTTTFAFSGGTPSTPYYARVAATLAGVNSGYSNVATATTISAFPIRLSLQATATINGLIYTFGGVNDGSGVDGSVLAYDPVADLWSSPPAVGPAPGLGEVGSAVLISGKVYVAGGASTGSPPVQQLNIYDPQQGSWTRGPDVPVASVQAIAGTIGGKLYVYAPGANALFVFDPVLQAWNALPSPPHPHTLGTGGAVGQRFFLVGGCDDVSCPTTRVDIYDPVTATWSTGAPVPTPRYQLGGTVDGTKIYTVGGYVCPGGCYFSNIVEAYDAASNTWTTLPTLRMARASPGVAVIGLRLYVIGGQIGQTGLYGDQTADVEFIELP